MTCTSTTTSFLSNHRSPPMITSHCYSPPMQACSTHPSLEDGSLQSTRVPPTKCSMPKRWIFCSTASTGPTSRSLTNPRSNAKNATPTSPLQCNLHFKRDPRTGSEPVFMQEEPDASAAVELGEDGRPITEGLDEQEVAAIEQAIADLDHAATTPSNVVSPKWAPFRCSPGKKKFGWPRRSNPPG